MAGLFRTLKIQIERRIFLEGRIPKEVRDYQEAVFFGLSMRQFIFSVLAIGVSVGLYFILRSIVGEAEIGWICILAALPFALCGFVKYNGMTAEKLALAVIRSEYLMPKRLVFKAENLYARVLEHSSVKEALAHD